MELIDRILSDGNIEAAIHAVKSNRGAAGIDKMTVDALEGYFAMHGEEIKEQIRAKKYKPQPVRRVYIPKANGKQRPLGIPTVVDRVIQQAVAQVVSREYEPQFSDHSYGFRPNRDCHKAIGRVLEYLNEGYEWVVDLDIEKYFDTVNHDKLISILRERVNEAKVLHLIRSFLRAGVMENGLVSPTEEGVPQGGPLSPVLSNIYLDKLDRELECRGLSFVRYADDCDIFVRSEKAADRVMASVSNWLERKLRLKVSASKTKVVRPTKSTFLGFNFWKSTEGWKPRPAKDRKAKLCEKVKTARIVRLIYRKFMEGMAPIGICRMLDEMGILTPGGKTHWRESTILSILSNEKYKGDALLQKTFTVDFLTKKHKRNEGEVQQYYVSGNHEAIIPPDEFEQVQAELARRKRASRAFSGNSVFASRLICGDCGGYYGQKVWHSNDPYRKVIWRCNRKYGKGQRCSTPTLSEDTIKALFVKAYNLLLGNRESVIDDCETLVAMLEDTATLDMKIAAAQEEIDTVVELNKALIREHAVTGIEQAAFDQKAAAYDERFRKADTKLNRLKAEKQDRLMRVCSVKKYVENLHDQAGPIEVWNEQAWCLLVTQVTVHADGSAEFLFRGENRITVK